MQSTASPRIFLIATQLLRSPRIHTCVSSLLLDVEPKDLTQSHLLSEYETSSAGRSVGESRGILLAIDAELSFAQVLLTCVTMGEPHRLVRKLALILPRLMCRPAFAICKFGIDYAVLHQPLLNEIPSGHGDRVRHLARTCDSTMALSLSSGSSTIRSRSTSISM